MPLQRRDGPKGDVIHFFALVQGSDDTSKDGEVEAARRFMLKYGDSKPAVKPASKTGPLKPYPVREYAREKVDLPESWLRDECNLKY